MLGILRRFDFLKNLFGPDESAAKAKERLRIVLIQDQSNISSELLNVLRNEMIDVVSRYLEIDVPHLEMGIERREGAVALAASIPIVRIRKEGRALIGPESPDIAPGSDNTKAGTAAVAAKNGPPESSGTQNTETKNERQTAVAVAPSGDPAASRSRNDRRSRRSRRRSF